jgi:ribosome-binding factor A
MRRLKRINSLLKEVISEVIRKEVKRSDVSELFTILDVDVTKDFRYAKVSLSVIGSEEEKQKTLKALNEAASFIAFHSSKRVVMHYFPELRFELDNSTDKHMHIDSILNKIHKEEDKRNGPSA